jgi:GNAT superfamily N-acetyltransferase
VKKGPLMEATIRRAEPDDADACAAIHVAAWEASYRGIVPDEEFARRPLERRQRQWRDWLARDDHVTLVACDSGGRVLGFAGANLVDRHETGFDSYLAMLYLQPEMKGRGLGKALLAEIAAELIALGARSMVLRTLRLNASRSFYERLGARLIPDGVPIDAGVFDDVVYAFDDLRTLAVS